mgnify:CR=1 FL=1
MKKNVSPRKKRHRRVRKKVYGTAERPRLNVFRSKKHIYAQAVDDIKGVTLVSASSLHQDLPSVSDDEGDSANRKVAKAVGRLIAEKLKSSQIEDVVFDRGGYLYHGRVKALAEGAREGGLRF